MHAALARTPHDLARGNRRPERHLLDRRGRESGLERMRSRAYWASAAHVSPTLAEPLRAQPRERHEPGQREQRLVRRDVRGCLLPPDVLLAGLQREDERATGRPRRPSPPTMRPGIRRVNSCPRREEAVMRAAVQRRAPGALPLSDRPSRSRNPLAPRAIRASSGRRGRSDAHRRRSRRGERGRVLEAAEKFGCWKNTAAASSEAAANASGSVTPPRARPRRPRSRNPARTS
jgi:hypothetical protein